MVGILTHGRSIQAFTDPSMSSCRRLMPHDQAPVDLACSASNRSAPVRIPHVGSGKARRFAFRCPDASGSPCLNTAAILMAAIDGIRNQIDTGKPMDRNIHDLPPEEPAQIPGTCADPGQALDGMRADKSRLTAGDVFTEDMIDADVACKRENEVEPFTFRPDPCEFYLCYDC